MLDRFGYQLTQKGLWTLALADAGERAQTLDQKDLEILDYMNDHFPSFIIETGAALGFGVARRLQSLKDQGFVIRTRGYLQ